MTKHEIREITRILVANRGEVAVRVIRSAREMGIETVAVYAEQDVQTLACDLADQAYSLGSTLAKDTYLNAEAIIAVAKRAKADAIHPGYGFLAENAEFAEAVEAAGIRWIGPSARSIESLGDKIRARQIAEANGVGTIPGISSGISDAQQVHDFANHHGFPILIKKADSGGGMGITRLDAAGDIDRFFTDHADEETLRGSFVEKLVEYARHVETQCMRDKAGHFAVVSTRDCSVQRRNQKVIEEAPAPHLPEETVATINRWSEALFNAVDYVGVGTCEFLIGSDGNPYFLEVNPRLQVEHTVSEEVAGIDLVREQIRITRGDDLPQLPQLRGHSIEARLTSENPADDLMPNTGRITRITWPGGLGVRVDSFIREGDSIGADFDSLIAKIIVRAPDRQRALARLHRALWEFSVDGLPTSAPLIEHIIRHPDFVGPDAVDAPADAAFAVYTKWMEDTNVLKDVKARMERAGEVVQPTQEPESIVTYIVELAGKRMHLKLPEGLLASAQEAAQAVADLPRQRLRGARKRKKAEAEIEGSDAIAPIQATVVRIAIEPHAKVAEGDLLVVLESMKMEKYIYASCNGTVEHIHVGPGKTVKAGDLLISIKEDE
ncbi:MAG: biotin carboxylase N-terminal domain-containing protein [Actinomycetaceae bacterium]|nr:biotin carboxylase N-terminal domain-containing protein [Actinomycetaceae bacterium]